MKDALVAMGESSYISRAREQLSRFIDECIDCGVCQANCDFQAGFTLTVREMLAQVLRGEASQEARRYVTRCALCGLCSHDCPVGLNVPQAVMAARQILIASGAIDVHDFQAMLVDQDFNLFTLYRDTYDIHYDDLERKQCESVFFPGCTLASYAPELTRAAYRWLETNDGPIGLTEECCGVPLAQIGLTGRAANYTQRLQGEFARLGARRLITACPECHYYLKDTMPNLEIVSLYELMLQKQAPIPAGPALTVHDSCPDRSGAIGGTLRRLLSASPLVEMAHHGANTICCGSGGIVSMVDPDICAERARTRLAELSQSGASACVTACMACAYRLARASDQAPVLHFLELALGVQVDYAEIRARGQAMWQGEWGDYNRARLAQARIL